MGYGEVGGGGSLQWQMTHDNKKPKHVAAIPGKKQQGEAIDPDVNDGQDLYLVIKLGVVMLADANQVIVKVRLKDHDDVRLAWGVDAPVSLQDVETLDLSKLQAARIATT